MSRSRPEVDGASIAVAGAVKRFGRVTALDGLSLAVRPGEWCGLVGPNGAGKTTLMQAIAGILPLDAGTIDVAGRPGWVPQEIALYPALTARENLDAFGRLHGLRGATLSERVDWALDWSGLAGRAGDLVDRFSGGMKRRLNIAAAVLHRPAVVLLDEPTVGVDPQARHRLFAMLDELRRDGTALLQSSHQLDDLEANCDTLQVVDGGRSIAAGPVETLVRETLGHAATLTLEVRDPRGGERARRIELDDVATELPALLEEIRRRQGRILRLDLRRPGLSDVFTGLTGAGLRE